MSLGSDIQEQVNNIITDESFRSDITITKVAVTTGTDGGYEGKSEVIGTVTPAYCVPYDFFVNNPSFEKMGNLQTGDIGIVIQTSEDLDEDDMVTFQSVDYDVRTIEKVHFNGVDIAAFVTLKKKTLDTPVVVSV